MRPINDPFSRSGAPAKTKFLLLGSTDFRLENLMNQVRSLNIEHVSPNRIVRPEISRRPVNAAAEEVNTLAQMRRWFFTRKPDAGFVLDEWLEARDESLHGVLAGPGSNESVVLHYRTLGLVIETSDLAA
jgi:adenylate kinase